MLSWRRAISFYSSLAIAADSILVLQGTSVSPSAAQNPPSSAVPEDGKRSPVEVY
jgi:hypothetical protein